MKKLFLTLLFFFMLCFSVQATNYYIDPTCGTPGDGTSHNCTGAGTDPFDSWTDVTFNAANDYFMKCGTTENRTALIQLPNITATVENHMVVGAYYIDGSVVTSQDEGFDYATCAAKPIIQESGGTNDLYFFAFNKATAYVDFEYLRFIDGRTNFIAANGENLSNVTWRHCDISEGATKYGIRTMGGVNDNITIEYCTFDTKIGTHNQPTGDLDLQDGIAFYHYLINSTIAYNSFIDIGHTSVYLTGTAGNISNNNIHNNYFNRVDGVRMRAFELFGSYTVNNKVHHNWINNMASPSKLWGSNNELYRNIFSNHEEINDWDDSGAAVLINGADGAVSGNKIYNNNFYEIDGFGIGIVDASWFSRGNISNIDIINNLFINVGNRMVYPVKHCQNKCQAYMIFVHDYDDKFSNLNISNNVFYTASRTQTPGTGCPTGCQDEFIYYRDAQGCTVAEMEAQAVTEGDTSADNVQSSLNNNMTDPSNDDFTLKVGADSIDAGQVLATLYSDGWEKNTDMPPDPVSTVDDRGYGLAPDAGAYTFSIGITIAGTSLINEECGDDSSPYEDTQNVAFSLTSTENANCNYEVKATASPCDGESYTTLTDEWGYGGGAMTTGQNTKIHSENAVMSCATTRYAAVICSAVEGDSNCLEITLNVAAGGDVDPQPNVGDGINIKTGGTVSIITGGTVSIE